VLYHLALAYDKNGDEELARQTLRKINAIKQDFPEAADAKKLYAALGGKYACRIHRRDTEVAEFVVFLNQELFTQRSPRLRGEISESDFVAVGQQVR
jgi:hypothetical protein